MKKAFLLIFSVLLIAALQAQEQRHVVFLKNKDNNPYTLSDPLAFLTQRSLDRRTKAGIALDNKDLPVTPSYISQIAAAGATVIYPLKWFNAVVVSTNDPAVLAAIGALPFVDHVDQVMPDNPVKTAAPDGTQSREGIPPCTFAPPRALPGTQPSSSINYGMAYNQAHMIAVDGLHDLGYLGDGMVIAVLDAGFLAVDQISAFDSLWMNNRILGTRDYHIPGNNVFADGMHSHGTSVLSTMGANLPGEMVGTAPHANYWLIRTEVGEFELLIEEYNWCAGAEFADSVGADIINSSLGYTVFDNPVYNHTYQNMDGESTPVTRAADWAAGRGILVVNSAGNEGSSAWHYIGAPADGDSVFSIGAVDAAGFYAGFSSVGPTYDGRIKPDVVAQGAGTTVVSGGGWVVQGSGTSFSSPVTAGALACLMQSSPALSAQQIRNNVRNTASRATNPDDNYGYGIPNMMNALSAIPVPDDRKHATGSFSLTPNPFSASPALQKISGNPETTRIEVLSATGQTLFSGSIGFETGHLFRLDMLNRFPAGIYFIRLTGEQFRQVIRAVKI